MAQGCEGRVTNGRQEERRTDAQETKRVQQGKVGTRSATRLNAGLNPHVGQVGQDPGLGPDCPARVPRCSAMSYRAR